MITDHYLFSLFLCDPIAREWYPCDVAIEIVSIFYTYTKGYRVVLYVHKRSQGITICNWKGHGEVSLVPIMNIQSNDLTRDSTFRALYEYTILWLY